MHFTAITKLKHEMNLFTRSVLKYIFAVKLLLFLCIKPKKNTLVQLVANSGTQGEGVKGSKPPQISSFI